MKQYMPSDEEYRTLLSGGSINAELDHNDVLKSASVRFDGIKPTFSDPNVFYPYWKIDWNK